MTQLISPGTALKVGDRFFKSTAEFQEFIKKNTVTLYCFDDRKKTSIRESKAIKVGSKYYDYNSFSELIVDSNSMYGNKTTLKKLIPLLIKYCEQGLKYSLKNSKQIEEKIKSYETRIKQLKVALRQSL